MRPGFELIHEISLASDPSVLVDVENLVNKICEKLNIPEDTYGNILIAVSEATTNAIQHGNENNKDLDIAIRVYDNKNSFYFNIIDKGKGFNFNDLPDPTSPENILKENGRGIFLMKNLSDDVVFNGSGNSVDIYFNK